MVSWLKIYSQWNFILFFNMHSKTHNHYYSWKFLPVDVRSLMFYVLVLLDCLTCDYILANLVLAGVSKVLQNPQYMHPKTHNAVFQIL